MRLFRYLGMGNKFSIGRIWFLVRFACCVAIAGHGGPHNWAQPRTHIHLHRYGYESGMSHRNVFALAQTPEGFVWLATINGLNRYDGYRFRHYEAGRPVGLPAPPYQALASTSAGTLWLGARAQLVRFHPVAQQVWRWSLPAEDGEAWQIQKVLPQGENTCFVLAKHVLSGQLRLWRRQKGQWQDVAQLPAAATAGALSAWGKAVLWLSPHGLIACDTAAAGSEAELWLQPDGARWPFEKGDAPVALYNQRDRRLWALSEKGRVYYSTDARHWTLHEASRHWPKDRTATTLLVTPEGDLWIGGHAELLWFEARTAHAQRLGTRFEQLFEYPPVFRQLLWDTTGLLWAASEFGALTAVPSRPFFRRYLHGGNDRCTNGFCSIRGMTYDDKGKVYISYYHGIHVLDLATGRLAPFAPGKPFFHNPFGLLWAHDALWTGDGLRIHLPEGPIDTLLPAYLVGKEGVVARDAAGRIWLGCGHTLARLAPQAPRALVCTHELDTSAFSHITYLEPAQPDSLLLWVSTDGAGVFLLDSTGVVRTHVGPAEGLAHPRVLATLHLGAHLWIATAAGLHAYHLPTRQMRRWTQAEGLPNDFINGLLPEGDSAIWISTDLGLARLRLADYSFQRFYREDGLAQNEFNRIAFARTPDGWMLFGGLNGVTAFQASAHMERLLARPARPLVWTGCSWFDTRRDTLIQHDMPLPSDTLLRLRWTDRLLQFRFAPLDFSHRLDRAYSWRLTGHTDRWSAPSTVPEVLINELAGGRYTLEVRAHTSAGQHKHPVLRLHLEVAEAWYRQPVWWLLMAVALLLASGWVFRYRLRRARARASLLARMVEERTRELARAREQSEALLRNILPASIAEELKRHGRVAARRHPAVSVLFTDFSNFSHWAGTLPPEQLVAEIDRCFRAFDEIVEHFQLEKIKTIGDAYMCAAGLFAQPEAPAQAIVDAAVAMQRFMQQYRQRQPPGAPTFSMRVGIHTGPVVAGVVGTKKFAFDIWGHTVNIAQRLEQHCPLDGIQISEATLAAGKYKKHPITPNGFLTLPDGQRIRLLLVQWQDPPAHIST